MAKRTKPRNSKIAAPANQPAAVPLANVVKQSLKWLEARGSQTVRDTIGPKYGIHTEQSFGVPVGTIHELASELKKTHGPKGTNMRHELAHALWETGWYEARLLAAFIDDPARVTLTQMNRWASDFDNWAICDTACFHLFDRTEYAINRIGAWARRDALFVKRAAFALLASVALHDKEAEDAVFLDVFPLIEAAADDDRNFVKKAVSWALRGIGKRNATLRSAAIELSTRLSTSDDRTRRWIGKDALRDLNKKPATRITAAAKAARAPAGNRRMSKGKSAR